MSGARKARKSVSIAERVAVNTREVNVAVEGVDASAIGSSFAVHLVKDGQRIASRFFFQPSDPVPPALPDQFAYFDFVLPIHVVADGTLGVEIEPERSTVAEQRPQREQIGRATLSVYLMLDLD